jgi:hypothetical protein
MGQNLNKKPIKFFYIFEQSRIDGVSRISNAYGPTSKRGSLKKKIYTRYFFLLTSPRDLHYGSVFETL